MKVKRLIDDFKELQIKSTQRVSLDWLIGLGNLGKSPIQNACSKNGLNFEEKKVRLGLGRQLKSPTLFEQLYKVKNFQEKQVKYFSERVPPSKSTKHRCHRFTALCVWTDDKPLFSVAFVELIKQFNKYKIPIIFRNINKTDIRPNVFCDLNIWWCDPVILCAKLNELGTDIFRDRTILIWNWPYKKFHYGFEPLLAHMDEVWSDNLWICKKLSYEHNKRVEFLAWKLSWTIQSTKDFNKTFRGNILVGFLAERHILDFMKDLLYPQLSFLLKSLPNAKVTLFLDLQCAQHSQVKLSLISEELKKWPLKLIIRQRTKEHFPNFNDFDYYLNANLTSESDPYESAAAGAGLKILSLQNSTVEKRIKIKNPMLPEIPIRAFKPKQYSLTGFHVDPAFNQFQYRQIIDRLLWADLI